ncbi:MAG: S8 family serine peptidase, partial [Methylocella sp.]
GVELCPGDRTSTCAADLRQNPDITAADGVSTAAPGFNPFYGTSAAAPHAAAIAALIKSAVPAITAASLRTALISSAIDIETAGVDRDTGAGIVMAQAAIQAAGGVPQAVLDAGTPVYSEFAGDGDAFIEPNEVWRLIVPLQNIGGVAAMAISATLTTATANVTLINSNSGYPDLAPSASANNTLNYSFLVGASFGCGGKIDFMLQASYSGGANSPQDFAFASDTTGGTGAPVAFSYAGAPVFIPDAAGGNPGAPAQASVLGPAIAGNIKDVDLSIDGATCTTGVGATTVGIDHTFVADLEITLISPSANSVLVINRTDLGGNNFCQTVLDDESGGPSIQSVVSSNAP